MHGQNMKWSILIYHRIGKTNDYVKSPFQNQEGELKLAIIIDSSY